MPDSARSAEPYPVELILVRHAQTVANVEGRWTGWQDTEITELGRAQIAATARRLALEAGDTAALYTSPLRRAWETAMGIGQALALTPIPLDDLREIHFGALDGISLAEMEARYPSLYTRWKDKSDVEFTWPGGERRADFFRRVAAACDDILARHSAGTVIVVGHGGTLRSCLAYLLPQRLGQWWTYDLANCGLTRIVLAGGQAHLVALNDTSHLPASA